MNSLCLEFGGAIAALEAHYGIPEAPQLTDCWQQILRENVVYLANDERRAAAFDQLRSTIGLEPERILGASDNALLSVSRHGSMAERFASKQRDCARILIDEFGGDLGDIAAMPIAQAKKALGMFPGIGEPGAEKILLFARFFPVLALDSNGLQVMLRLGFGEDGPNYGASYRSAQKAVASETEENCAWLIKAHQLLRKHGQEICRRKEPCCGECPLSANCCYFNKIT